MTAAMLARRERNLAIAAALGPRDRDGKRHGMSSRRVGRIYKLSHTHVLRIVAALEREVEHRAAAHAIRRRPGIARARP